MHKKLVLGLVVILFLITYALITVAALVVIIDRARMLRADEAPPEPVVDPDVRRDAAAPDPVPRIRWRPVPAIVTAFCPCQECCGKWALVDMKKRRLPSGHLLQDLIMSGRPFCAAPAVLPFGAVARIPGYGQATVLDRGGTIRLLLDVFFVNHADAVRWGRKPLVVEIMEVCDADADNAED